MADEAMDRRDDWLERTLRTEAADRGAQYLGDDGFTDRVLANLPPPAALPRWRNPAVILLWLLATGVGVAALPNLAYDLFRSLVAAVVVVPLTLPRIVIALAVLAALAWSTIVYALRED
jgi:hypothetical protein